MPLFKILRPTLPILIGASLMLTLSMGLRQSLGIFMQPLTHDVGISISDFTLAIAMQNLAWGFLQPLAGAMTVRYGFRPIMVVGAFFYIAGLVLMASAHGFVGVLIGGGALIGTSLACTAAAIAMSVAARAVPETVRSTVLGMVSAAGSLGALLSAPIGQILNEGYGWRVGLAGFVILSLALVPAAWFAGGVDKIPLPKPSSDDIGNNSAAAAAKVAFGNASFVVMTCAYFVCGMQLVFLTTHLPSYLAVCGLDPMLSAQTLGMIGGFNVLGSLFFGWAGQRWNKLALLGGIYIVRSIALAWYFTLPPTPATTLLFGAIMGFLWMGGRAAGRGRGGRNVRAALAGDDPGARLHEPSARQLSRRLWRRPDLRCARLLHHGLADRRRARSCRRHHPGHVRADPAERATTGGGAIKDARGRSIRC